jgi:peptidoglycan/LPS O-acetylase OafA/YrhL
VRFFAAAAVVFYHFGKQHVGHVPDFVRNVAGGGANGVALFFILSGFVLAYNYADSAQAGRLDKAEFWKARIARVYPVYLLSLVLTVSRFANYLHYALHPVSPANVLRALTSFAMVVTLTQAWDASRSFLWNFPSWTLSVEMLFYLTFPWACAAVCRLKPTKLLTAACALVILSFLRFVLISKLPPADGFWIWAGSEWPPMRLPEFFLGLVLGRMYLVRSDIRIRHRDAAAMLATAGIVTVVGFGPQLGIFVAPLLDPLFAVLIYALASGPGFVARCLSLPLLVLLGNASYAVYILQVPIMNAVNKIFGFYGLTFFAGLLALTGISTASYLYFETPARRWIRKRWVDRNEPLPAEAALVR